MKLSDFKLVVADYMNRDAVATFQSGTVGKDKILLAINNARAFAQRLVKFEAARTYATVSVFSTTGGDLVSGAWLLTDPDIPCRVRNIEKAFVENTQGVWYPINVVTHGPKLEVIQKELGDNVDQSVIQTSEVMELTKDGNTVWLMPYPGVAGPVEVKLRVIRWLPELTQDDGDYEDFFFVECLDWVLYKCVQELNFLLKEDQRIQLSDATVTRAWETVKAWNTEQALTADNLEF